MLFFFVTAAVFSAADTTPVRKESFIILKIARHKELKQDLNKLLGTGSSVQVVTFICDTIPTY